MDEIYKLFIDIETIPTQRQDIKDAFNKEVFDKANADIANIKVPGNISKAETIAEWHEKKRPALVDEILLKAGADFEEKYRSTALSGNFGQIFCFGLAFQEFAAGAVTRNDWRDPATEASMLYTVHDYIDAIIEPNRRLSTVVIGHNHIGFDLRFYLQRCWIHNIMPHPVLQRAATAKPWETDKAYDTMTQWAGVGNRVKLDTICKALGIESPKDGGLDGPRVWDAVLNGNDNDVHQYNMRDVEALRRVYKRMTYQ